MTQGGSAPTGVTQGGSGWLGAAPAGGGPIMELGAAPVQSAPAGLQARPCFYRAVT